MYFFPLQFLKDLYSGKLHREFHYGPDKDEEKDESTSSEASSSEDPASNEVRKYNVTPALDQTLT